MFSFMKKGSASGAVPLDKEEKEKRKREKKERKEKEKKERGSMTAEELLRLDEVRRSLKIRSRRKEKEKLPSGITADYSANFFAELDRSMDSNSDTKSHGGPGGLGGLSGSGGVNSSGGGSAWLKDAHSDTGSSEASLNSLTNYSNLPRSSSAGSKMLPPLPPRPPKRGILKGPRLSITSTGSNDENLLLRNTLQNEVIAYQNIPLSTSTGLLPESDSTDFVSLHESLLSERTYANSATIALSPHAAHAMKQSKSYSIESLTDSTTNSSFMTPQFSMSPVGEGQGFYSKFSINYGSTDNFEHYFLPLPDITPITLPEPRVLTIQRQTGSRNDFGFSLRRAMVTDRNSPAPPGGVSQQAVIFAEPGVVVQHKNETGLLPGDRLLEVDNVSVEGKTREQIIDMIKSAGASVTLKVQPVSELSELSRRSTADGIELALGQSNIMSGTLRRSACKQLNKAKAKSDEQLANDKAWLEQERFWLMHRRGFTGVIKVSSKSNLTDDITSGKVRVSVLSTGEEFTVDEDDLEKANPPQYDRSEDLSQLRFLNESSVLHTLRQRYAANLIHTYAGLSMLIVNPAVPLTIYSEKVAHMFRGCKSADMPAHIYSVAQSAYHSMLSLRRDHSIVFQGRAGSGKSSNYKFILKYFNIVAGANNKNLTFEKLNAVWNVLEAFGNARTVLNLSATRFAHLFSLDFDQSGQIASASIQTLLFDRWRVAKRPEGEGTFHILPRLVLGVDGNLKRDLMLGDLNPTDSNPYVFFNVSNEDRIQQASQFKVVFGSLILLGVSEVEIKIIFSVLAAILHLGAAGAAKGSTSSRWQFNSPIAAHRAAKCLGTTVEELSRIIFSPAASTPTGNRSSYHSTSSSSDGNRTPPGDEWTGQDAIDGFVIGLYSEVFNIVAALMNRHISVGVHTVNSILILDCPGFQNPASCGQQNGATFQDFCHNYLQERLQLLFHNTSLVATRDRYTQEQIDVTSEDTDEVSPEGVVNVLDNIPSTGSSLSLAMRSSQIDLRQSGASPGLFWLLDEHHSITHQQQSFIDSVFNIYREREHQSVINKAPGNHHLMIQHCQGTNPVLYNCENWPKLAREHPSTKAAVCLLLESTNNEIASVFMAGRNANISSTLGGSIAGIDGSQTLRRASSIRRTFTSGSAAAMKRKSVALQVKFSVDGLIETLRRTKLKFVHCLLPQHNVAAVDRTKDPHLFDSTINVPLLRSQLRGAEVLPAVRLYKQGFPDCMQISEFIRRFGLLASASSASDGGPSSTTADTKTSIEEILFGIDLDSSSYRVGLSQIFFRSGVLAQLEMKRDEKLTDRIIKLQSHCRGFLARKKLAKLKVEDLAVRCIQRNVRKFMSVRDWAWWRLLVRVTPLLNVHRTEEELKSKTEELENLRAKVEKLEQERTLLKHETDKLETKLSEMTVDLAEEHSTATVASERLEIETSERLRLEKELQEIQGQNKRLQENGERLELEVLCLHTAEVNGSALHSEDDDDESGDRTGVYKRRYERVARELEFTKRRLQQQHQDDLEQLIGLRKQLEKKLADAYEEVEEQRQVVAQWKRKVQKLNAELNDVRLLLEEQNSRNILLEKKQRKFDAELQMLQDELRNERQQKERASRERELAVGDKYSMEQTLSAVKLELELKEQKLANLNRELEELTFNGNTEEEVANLKKSKHQLDNKIKDQEEELDDLAGQVQMLEQAKLKLEMSLEQMRKEHRRELMQKDDEIEDARCSAVKKVKALECQLESEHEERTLLLRERHELERRLNDVEDRERVNRTNDQEQLSRLRRDLKRTKALLRDAQIMLQQAKADTPNKTILRQLRNQLDDAECARNLAMKARQTAEADLMETQLALEEATRTKSEAEDKAAMISRERSQIQSQLDENEEELAEVLKKYRATVQQLSSEQSQLREQAGKIAELETERQSLKDQLSEMTSRLENVETMNDPASSLTVKRLELKCKELESKLELEQTTRSRMEVQINRLKETAERLQSDADIARGRETAAQDLVRKLQRNIRDLKEQLSQHESRENNEATRRKELEKRLEESETETSAAKSDLRLALKRIEDLQLAIQGELDHDDEDDDSPTDSDNDSASSDESFESFMTNHHSTSAERSSVSRSNFSRTEEISPLKISNSSTEAKSSSPPSSFA